MNTLAQAAQRFFYSMFGKSPERLHRALNIDDFGHTYKDSLDTLQSYPAEVQKHVISARGLTKTFAHNLKEGAQDAWDFFEKGILKNCPDAWTWLTPDGETVLHLMCQTPNCTTENTHWHFNDLPHSLHDVLNIRDLKTNRTPLMMLAESACEAFRYRYQWQNSCFLKYSPSQDEKDIRHLGKKILLHRASTPLCADERDYIIDCFTKHHAYASPLAEYMIDKGYLPPPATPLRHTSVSDKAAIYAKRLLLVSVLGVIGAALVQHIKNENYQSSPERMAMLFDRFQESPIGRDLFTYNNITGNTVGWGTYSNGTLGEYYPTIKSTRLNSSANDETALATLFHEERHHLHSMNIPLIHSTSLTPLQSFTMKQLDEGAACAFALDYATQHNAAATHRINPAYVLGDFPIADYPKKETAHRDFMRDAVKPCFNALASRNYEYKHMQEIFNEMVAIEARVNRAVFFNDRKELLELDKTYFTSPSDEALLASYRRFFATGTDLKTPFADVAALSDKAFIETVQQLTAPKNYARQLQRYDATYGAMKSRIEVMLQNQPLG